MTKKAEKIVVSILTAAMTASISLASMMTVNAQTQNNASATVSSDGFVSAKGTHFYLNGEPYYFAGANSYDLFTLGDSSSDSTTKDICTKYMDPDKIESRIKSMHDNGITVFRTWGFSTESWHGFEKNPGEYCEAQFMLFDYIMYCARKYDMKVIITLDNYWEAYGGIDSQLKWAGLNGGSNQNRAQFFTNEKCKEYYKNYAEHFIDRTNYFTGVKYKDDPTVFAWDLMNEPRYQDVSTLENTSGKTLRKWVDEMGGYIKGLDQNHMVCVGLEGHGTGYGFGGDEGNPFVYIQQSPYIDFCCAHPYPDESWANLSPEQTVTLVKKWISDAHNKVGKPFIIGEFNVHSSLSADRYEAYWRAVFDTLYDEDAGGGMFWQFESRNHDSYSVADGDAIMTYYKNFAARMAAKSGKAAGGSSSASTASTSSSAPSASSAATASTSSSAASASSSASGSTTTGLTVTDAGSADAGSNTISNNIRIQNSGEALTLSKLKIRYYYTADSSKKQQTWCDNADINMNSAPWYSSLTSQTKAESAVMGTKADQADHYVEISFTSDQTLGKGDKLQVATRTAAEDWSAYQQNNDFSYQNADRIAVFYDNQLVSGQEP